MKPIPFFVIGVVLLFLAFFDPNPVRSETPNSTSGSAYLVPAKEVGWWYQNEIVQFRLTGADLAPEVTGVEGVVKDLSEKELFRATLDRSALLKEGWSWRPPEPGYYEVEFFAVTGQTRSPLARRFQVRANKEAMREFTRQKQGFAVLPSRTGSYPTVGQFGFTFGGQDLKEIKLAQLMGFDAVRLLVNWGANFRNPKLGIESVQGDYQWNQLDWQVDSYAKAGFLMVGQICYTPLWASPYPDKLNVNICVTEATAYAPADLGHFTRFVEATVNRYKDRLQRWEIWNEPAMAGGSCYWSDTPENFAKLLDAGYAAVKKAQPEAEVWIGGLGPNPFYYAFYNRILQLGKGRNFDVLSLHGSFCTPAEKFSAIEVHHQIKPKPAVQSEWHAILQGNMQSGPILSETALSMRMMKDLLYQLKRGVERTLLFEMTNLAEKETIEFCIENKYFTHSSGIFRKLPQIEPRHAAVVLANFIDVTGRKATFSREIKAAEAITAVELTTNKGPLLVFFSQEETIPSSAYAPFLTPESTLTDWEGKPVTVSRKPTLAGHSFYYLTAPNRTAMDAAGLADKLVHPRAKLRSAQALATGKYSTAPLFSSVESPAVVAPEAWMESSWKFTRLHDSANTTSFFARAAFGATESGLDVVVEVRDDHHVQTETKDWWNGDSVQIALDCEGTGLPGGNTEIVFALTDKGPVVWKLLAAETLGNIPGRWTSAREPVKHSEQKISRENALTRYHIRLPWSELYPLTRDVTRPLRVSLVVNDNNGSGRCGFLEWGGGITGEKDPALYGQLNPIEPK